MKDYYKILGVEYKSSYRKVYKNFRDKSLLCHPDNNQSKEALRNFIELNEAFYVLENKGSRSKYEDFYKIKILKQKGDFNDKEIDKHIEEWTIKGQKLGIGFSKISSKKFIRNIRQPFSFLGMLLDAIVDAI